MTIKWLSICRLLKGVAWEWLKLEMAHTCGVKARPAPRYKAPEASQTNKLLGRGISADVNLLSVTCCSWAVPFLPPGEEAPPDLGFLYSDPCLLSSSSTLFPGNFKSCPVHGRVTGTQPVLYVSYYFYFCGKVIFVELKGLTYTTVLIFKETYSFPIFLWDSVYPVLSNLWHRINSYYVIWWE